MRDADKRSDKCRTCLGVDTYQSRTVTFPFQFKDRVILLENVPAMVCSQCGEKLLASETAQMIDSLARGQTSPQRTVEIPVYDFADVD